MLAEGFLQAGGAPVQAACLLFLALGMGLLVVTGGALPGAGLWPRNAPGTTGEEPLDASRRLPWDAWLRGSVATMSVVCIPAFVTDVQGAGPSLLAGWGIVAGVLAWRGGAGAMRCGGSKVASVTILLLTAALAAPGGAVDAWVRGADPASVLRGELLGVGTRGWSEVGAAAPAPWPLGVLLVGALLARPRAGLGALAWACVGGVVAGHAGVGMLLLGLGDEKGPDASGR